MDLKGTSRIPLPHHPVFRYQSYGPASLDISMTLYRSGGSEFLFELLCGLDHNNELIPSAATHWTHSEDGTVSTCKILFRM